MELTENDVYDISIFDNTGKAILSNEYSERFVKIDLSALNTGLYFVKILDKTDNIVEFQELIV